MLISSIVRKHHEISIVAKVDKTLGFFLGLISGVIYFETIVMLIGAIPINALQELRVLIDNSSVAHFICSINPYDSIFSLISFDKISNFVYALLH